MEQSIESKLGQHVRLLRVSHGMTQAELASAMREQGCRVTQATIAKIEKGSRPLPVTEIIALAKAFGLRTSFFMRLVEGDPVADELAQVEATLAGLATEERQARDRIRDLEGEIGAIDRARQKALKRKAILVKTNA
ncbi:helix-turn-helix domain-containing protein [Arthrobacter cheniae]|nr:helix-turn-helix transcriptional regulator [Arthrobacter cheniae]